MQGQALRVARAHSGCSGVGTRGAAGFPVALPGRGSRSPARVSAEPGLATHCHSGRATPAAEAAEAARKAPARSASCPRLRARSRWLRGWRRVCASGTWAPLWEAWRWLRRPGGGPALWSRAPAAPPPCRRAGLGRRASGRGAAAAASGQCLSVCCSAGGCGDSRPVPSAPASAPSPRSAPASRSGAGPGGAVAGRALGREQ